MVITTKKRKIDCPELAAKVMRQILAAEDEIDRDKEHCWVIGLSGRKTVLYIELVSLGILTQGLVHPREVYRLAIQKAADGIILIHNHPSGDTMPSVEDIETTHRLFEAGKIIGISLVDHVIIGGNKFYSFSNKSMLQGGS